MFHNVVVRTTVLFCGVLPLAAHGTDETTHQRSIACILHRGARGHVWVAEPLLSLGMIGTIQGPPVYRLSPELAAEFQPLVNELKEPQKTPEPWIWGLPKVGDPSKPLIVVKMEFDAALRKLEKRPIGRGARGPLEPQLEYEITSLELGEAEFITARWREAWDVLDGNLREIVAVSRTAPGAAKRERLERAVEQASRSLGVMVGARVEPQSRGLLARLAPKARVVRSVQKRTEEEWGGQLRRYVARLRLSPATPLPPEAKPCPKLELLAASESPAELLTKVRRDWPEDVLDEPLIYAQGMKRTLAVREVETLTGEQFQALRAQAKEELSRAEAQRQRRGGPEPKPARVEIAQWGAVLRPAGADLLAEKGLLGGTVVESISAKAPDAVLRAGDVIIDYRAVYDLFMAEYPSFTAFDRLRGIARSRGKLEILRGGQIVTIELVRK